MSTQPPLPSNNQTQAGNPSPCRQSRSSPWRQGLALPSAVWPAVTSLGAFTPTEKWLALVVSHDCDLVNENLQDEPLFEVVMGEVVEEVDSNCLAAKNPRRLHLLVDVSGEVKHYEFHAKHRLFLDKRILLEVEPDSNVQLKKEELNTLTVWLANRYRRAAFPNVFVDRFRKVERDVIAAGKRHGEGVLGVYFENDPPDEEIDDESVPYEVKLTVVYSIFHANGATNAENMRAALQSAFEKRFYDSERESWKLIELSEARAMSEAEFTLADLRRTKQYKFDHLSLRDDPQGELPSEQ